MIMHEGTAAAKKILNTQYSCFSLGVRKFGGKFPFLSKVFLEELRCSTRGVQGHVRAWAAWIYYDLERDPSKHLLNTSWQSEENTVDCSLSEHTIQYFVCPSEYTWLYLNFMNNTPNFGNSLDVTWKLHQARHERVSGLSRIDFACRSKLLASQSVEDRNWHCQLETHSLGKIQDFPLFNDFKSFSFLAMLQRDITKCGHLQTWKIWTCPLPVFLDLRICARCLRNLWWVCG